MESEQNKWEYTKVSDLIRTMRPLNRGDERLGFLVVDSVTSDLVERIRVAWAPDYKLNLLTRRSYCDSGGGFCK